MFKLSGIKIGILVVIVILALLVLGLGYSSARSLARDRHRLADVQKIHDALKVFFEENGYYPYGTGTGEPTGLADYLETWPSSPVSSHCPNTYTYSQKAQGNSYELTFCLDQGAAGWGAGIHKVKP